MQSIAEISEVSTKTLYNLFGSRELLLLEAASERLADLGQSPSVAGSEPGIEQLLAFTVGTMAQFEEMPEFARAIISILVRAELDPNTAYERMGPVQRFAHKCLCEAAAQGELRDDIELEKLSYLIAANHWGTVLWWEKGLIPIEDLRTQIALSHCLTLTPLCMGKRQKQMQKKLDSLLAKTVKMAKGTARKPRSKASAKIQKDIRLVSNSNEASTTREE